MRDMTDSSRPADLNANITRVLRYLMADADGMSQSDVARSVGYDPTLISRSVKGIRPWKIEDVEALARLFDVPPAVFFEEPGRPVRSRWFRTLVTTQSGERVS
jgi:transcriptional regulator with XRE-family HTH domain